MEETCEKLLERHNFDLGTKGTANSWAKNVGRICDMCVHPFSVVKKNAFLQNHLHTNIKIRYIFFVNEIDGTIYSPSIFIYVQNLKIMAC